MGETTGVRERPILFSGPMVRAIIEGRKTVTRRIVQSPARNMQREGMEVIKYRPPGDPWCRDHVWSMRNSHGVWGDYTDADFRALCPYGQPGDRLWVRETWRHIAHGRGFGLRIEYPADGSSRVIDPAPDRDDRWRPMELKQRPSIHMPRWASRLTLEVTGVRVERLQDISEEDARAEGVEPSEDDDQPWRCYSATCERDGGCAGVSSARRSFETLWDSINADRAPWASNPWVWAVSFKVGEVRR